jgi:putative spermidine/putrescine transport system permease protein/spermidine/putrescine transport system permease protein
MTDGGLAAAAAAGPGRSLRAALHADLVRSLSCLPALGLVLFIVVAPVGWLFFLSVRDDQGFTWRHYQRMLDNPGYATSLSTTLLVSAIVTVLSAVLAYPVAYFLRSLRGAAARIVLIVVLLPLWTALLVRTFAWLVLLQRHGLVNNLLVAAGAIAAPLELVNNQTGTVIGMTHVMIPFMTLPLLAAMEAIDPALIRAAESLGASRTRAFWGVFFPLSLPGLLAGGVLIFVMSLGFYVTPAFLGGGRVLMWSMKIETSIDRYTDWGAASALGVVLLLITLAILWAGRRLVAAIARSA